MRYIGLLVICSFLFSCAGETKTVQDLDTKTVAIEKILDGISIDSPEGKVMKTHQNIGDKFVIELQFPLADTGIQVAVEVFDAGNFSPIMADNISSQGELSMSISYLPNNLYRIVTEGKGLFLFSDQQEIKGKVKETSILGKSAWDFETISSAESKQMQDFIVFSSALKQTAAGQKKLVGFLKGEKTGYVHYVNSNILMQNSDENLELINRLKKDFSDEEQYPYAKDYQKVFAIAPQIGDLAPEINLPTLEGGMAKLSDLRGKVVLLDFWASWCGPCRRENPNVLKMYNEFHRQGFDIFGVSLDKTKKAWEQAVNQDGLTWTHVSDLKFWQSAGAKTYKVQSIPQTFLINKDGVIVAIGLRGLALEQKVKEWLNK
jgi:peroxiredoxin